MVDQNSSTQITIPFKVSARTARLIGRENIATSKGAIIELVKNGYDADSKASIVYFDNKYSTILSEIDEHHFNKLIEFGISENDLNNIYTKNDDDLFNLKNDIDELTISALKDKLNKLSILYIIDFGDGMTQNIIRDHWMTIGTDNKASNIFTNTGRVRAGAKGIGRFALDKLGSRCEMITIFNPNIQNPDTDINGNVTNFTGYNWKVNWEDFEGEFKTIDKVGAVLTGLFSESIKEELSAILPNLNISQIEGDSEFKYGTVLKVMDLRDNWEDYFVGQVYEDLEVLVPPKEAGGFEIYVYSSLLPQKYGEVLGSICDDFDYKLVAKADNNQNVHITIYRNEYDLEAIPSDFFMRDGMLKSNYRKEDFLKGYWEKNTSFSKLLKGFNSIDEDNTFDNIGSFEFTFYFLKRQNNSSDSKRFFNRNFMSNNRKDWLNKFGGVKLFRDNFRVRPYGEINNVAFDWLGLGSRKSQSPASVAKKEGGYRVEPDNVAGAISISRLTNVNFDDKSSREGLQENKTFSIFTRIITEIIAEFEDDRSYIAREMSDYDNKKYGPQRDSEKAEKIKNEIITKYRDKKQQDENASSGNNENDESFDEEKILLASEIDKKDEEIEKLKEEQKLLRALASSGIVLASFSHDLSKLNQQLSLRTDKLKDLISQKISEEDFENVVDRKNPFILIERIKTQDVKLQNWLNFSLGAARKDKRTRRLVMLKPYFHNFKNDWSTVLQEKAIDLNIDNIVDIGMRVFEIDLDSIFNNLLVNSIDAFLLSKSNRNRKIDITLQQNDKELIIEYHDNGTGISNEIENPEKIFEPLFTTKRNQFTGAEEGTGLGMWLVSSIVKENDGNLKLLYPEFGFGIRISFPVKYKK
ncbi:sensor histidine kinase [Chryseobacterium culicis]|uniref:histidine kinase n=1 Tax=Chryseobacterium culicis TaxID=680127 RepID=A0A1H6GX83_CHRCI|nr:HAMP domain-containing sensor histidine kinase [Chryseobacterium culicis]SEH27472.1 Histidine kinase-, DNA gyrase B-, and HSP90-like ATPase [Chryseobacterium culicis]